MFRTALLCLFICQPLVAADWPVFRGSPQMMGVGVTTLPDKLDEVWMFKCKDSGCQPSRRIVQQHRALELKQWGSFVVFLSHPMHRTPAFRLACGDDRLMHPDAIHSLSAVLRQQTRVNIENSPTKRMQDL